MIVAAAIRDHRERSLSKIAQSPAKASDRAKKSGRAVREPSKSARFARVRKAQARRVLKAPSWQGSFASVVRNGNGLPDNPLHQLASPNCLKQVNRGAIWKKSEMAPRLTCSRPRFPPKIRDSRSIDRLSRIAPVQSGAHVGFLPDGRPIARLAPRWCPDCTTRSQMTPRLHGLLPDGASIALLAPRWPAGCTTCSQMASRLHGLGPTRPAQDAIDPDNDAPAAHRIVSPMLV